MNLRKKALLTVSSAVSGNEPATTYVCTKNLTTPNGQVCSYMYCLPTYHVSTYVKFIWLFERERDTHMHIYTHPHTQTNTNIHTLTVNKQ